MYTKSFNDENAAKALADGGVAVIPTDTLYGLVASARQPQAVARVYELKGRSLHKPCIILVPNLMGVREFGVREDELQAVAAYWPGPLSAIFSVLDSQYEYLSRDIGMPPFRVPANEQLRHFLLQTGPLIAPSANMQGEMPAATIADAQAIFGNKVDFYIDGGDMQGEPSTIVKVSPSGELQVVRQGAQKL